MEKLCRQCGESKNLKLFHKNKTVKDGYHNRCKECRKNENYSESARTRNSQFVWDYLKEHPCVDCEEDDPIVLDFDHVRGKKKVAISRMIQNGSSICVIKEEIKKCFIRCSNCHRRRTSKQFEWYKNINLD